MQVLRRPDPHEATGLARLVEGTLVGAMATLQAGSDRLLEPDVRRRSQDAVERLWQRRDALTRLLRWQPSRQPLSRAAPPGMKQWTLVDEATVEMDIATGTLTRVLMDAVEVEWRELQVQACLERQHGPQWPPSPLACAGALRAIVEIAAGDLPVRLALMRAAVTVLTPEFVTLCRDQLHPQPSVAAGPAPTASSARTARPPRAARATAPIARPMAATMVCAPVETPVEAPLPAPAAPAAEAARHDPPAAAGLLDSAQPGRWFRMVLHDQWTVARVTWRSDRGHFFLFSSRLAGRSHSLSRTALENLIQRGQFQHVDQASR